MKAAILNGHNNNAQQVGMINYYNDDDIPKWCDGFVLQETFGLKTF